MAIVTEDGSGKPDAEAYCTVDFADAYHAARGNEWAGSASVKEAALRRATDYMAAYTWKGERISATQALAWPRDGVVVDGYEVDADSVPAAVQRACAELALRALTEPLAPDLDRQVVSETIDAISVTYAQGARESKRWAAAENLLRPYLTGSSGVRLVRA